MRRDHHVVALQQLRKYWRYARFTLEDIQASPRNALRALRCDQGLGLHDRPAPDVDEIAVRSERGEHVRVDEVPRPRAPRRGGNQEIGPCREIEETGEIAVGRAGDRRPSMIADLHVEAARGALCNPAPDFSETEHP